MILTSRPILNRMQLQGANNIAEHRSQSNYPAYQDCVSRGGSFAIPPSSYRNSRTNVAGSRDFQVSLLFRLLT